MMLRVTAYKNKQNSRELYSLIMPLKTFEVSNLDSIEAEPLTPESFAPFGGVISADHQIKNVEQSSANYGTAIKIKKVTPVVNAYDKAPSQIEPTPNWNIYRCSPPVELIEDIGQRRKKYTSKVLERHPFTTQTFVPMGNAKDRDSYLVIVAKTDAASSPLNLPDPKSVKAFVCKGNQSVTYGKGIWHAPMVVIDEDAPHIDFAVFVHENGVPQEDCQECYFTPGMSIHYDASTNTKL